MLTDISSTEAAIDEADLLVSAGRWQPDEAPARAEAASSVRATEAVIPRSCRAGFPASAAGAPSGFPGRRAGRRGSAADHPGDAGNSGARGIGFAAQGAENGGRGTQPQRDYDRHGGQRGIKHDHQQGSAAGIGFFPGVFCNRNIEVDNFRQGFGRLPIKERRYPAQRETPSEPDAGGFVASGGKAAAISPRRVSAAFQEFHSGTNCFQRTSSLGGLG